MSIEPFFFERAMGDARALYGSIFRPSRTERAFVMCGGFAGEFEVFRSHTAHIARNMASQGSAVLRFDYLGYGDSDGEFTDASLDTMCDDTMRALDELKAKTGMRTLGLMGLRLGGTVAALVAARRNDIDTLVLWEPVLKPWDDLYAELRQTLSLQTVLFRDIKMTREQIVENVLAGQPSMVDGYDLNVIDDGFPLSAALIESVKRVDLVEQPVAIAARTLVVHIRKKEGPTPKPLARFVDGLKAAGTDCALTVAIEPSLPWRHEDFYMTHSPKVCEATLAWLAEAPSELRIGA